MGFYRGKITLSFWNERRQWRKLHIRSLLVCLFACLFSVDICFFFSAPLEQEDSLSLQLGDEKGAVRRTQGVDTVDTGVSVDVV